MSELGVVRKRSEMLRVIAERPRTKPALVDRLGVSRSTVDRAVRELREAGLVESIENGYTASVTGRLALARYDAFHAEIADVFDADPVLSALRPETDVPITMVTGARTVRATDDAPYRPAEEFRQTLRDADRCRLVVPTIADARQLRVLYDRVVAGGATVELAVPSPVVDHLTADYAARLAGMADTDRFTLSTIDRSVPYGVAVVESDGEVTAWLLAFHDDGRLAGLVVNDTDEAVAWGRSWCASRASAGTDVTDRVRGARESPGLLSARLRREGIVDLADCTDRTADPPRVAWRAGLGLPEVYAGFAVERTDPATGEPLSETVLETLRAGNHCAVVGPPGIGKSTLCKQVAWAWHADENGPVLYRTPDGEAFTSVDELVETVRSVAGRPLIVVEDAVRPGAREIAAVVDRIDPSEAAVMVDARAGEWESPVETDRERTLRAAVETIRVPTLSARDRDRLIERVETTLDADVPTGNVDDRAVNADDQAVDVDDRTVAETPSLVLHRLVTAVDDSAFTDADPTSLEAAFDELLAELSRVDGLDAGLTAALLNVAGVTVRPSHARVIAGENAVDVLDGSVFLRTDGEVRVVGHAWSLRLLSRAADRRPEATAAAVERGVAALAALATTPTDRAHHRGGERAAWLDELAADPTGWLDELVRTLFETLRSLPALAGVFERGDHRVRIPDRVSPRTEIACRLDRARAHADADDDDRAAAALDRVADRLRELAAELDPATRDAYRAELAVMRGTLARRQEDLAAASEQYRTALDHAGENARQRGRAHNGLGVLAGMRGEVPDAVEQFEAALDASRAADDPVTQSNVLRNMGNVAALRGDADTAVGRYEESIDLARRHGLFTALAGRYVSLGEAHLERGTDEDAEAAYTQGLRVARRVGAPEPEVNAIGGLGELALERGDFETAASRFEQAAALATDRDLPRRLATATHKLGVLARRRGDERTALDHLRDALDTAATVEDARLRAEILTDLGLAEVAVGDFERAESRFRRALQTLDGTGLDAHAGRAKRGLAAVAFERDDLAAAERRIEAALDRLPEAGRSLGEAQLLAGRIAAARGNLSTARESLSAAAETFRAAGTTERATAASDRRAEVDAERRDVVTDTE